MKAFASMADYIAKYEGDADEGTLETWLENASRIMRDEMTAAGINYERVPDDTLADVCRDMVHRALGGDDDGLEPVPYGVTQVNMTGGSYSRGYSFANPYEELFLTAAERRRLGIGLERACVLSPYGGD